MFKIWQVVCINTGHDLNLRLIKTPYPPFAGSIAVGISIPTSIALHKRR